MPSFSQKLMTIANRIPAQSYLWLAVPIFGAASAITRKITEIGAQNFVDGQNPISLCNVLFVGNLCALLLFGLIHRQQWKQDTLQRISRREWLNLIAVAVLSGALAPAFIFQALAITPVTNVVVAGRLEPPLTLALSIWLLRDRVNSWELLGAATAFGGVMLTILLQPATAVGGWQIGRGEVLAMMGAVALSIATIASKKGLAGVPLGIYNTVRTGLGTIVFFCIALALYGPRHFTGVLSPFLWQWMLLYGAVIVVMGQLFWTAGLRVSSIASVSLAGSLMPIFGILAAYWILGEVPTLAQYIGGGVISIGLLFSQIGVRYQHNRQQKVTAVDVEQSIAAKMGFKGI
jgi:drug/metabolite transporter (DMT)-like permease